MGRTKNAKLTGSLKASNRKKKKNRNPAPAIPGKQTPAVNLAFNPLQIDDPHHERRIIEKQGRDAYAIYLAKAADVVGFFSMKPKFEERISEVYRLCFQSSKQFSVVKDFVAICPDLVFGADWLRKMVTTELRMWNYQKWGSRGPNPLFLALSKGFRRASDPRSNIRRSIRRGGLEAARQFQKVLQGDLENRLSPLDLKSLRAENARERLETLVSQEFTDIVNRYGLRISSGKEKIKKALLQGSTYEASALITAQLYRVSKRALERKPPS